MIRNRYSWIAALLAIGTVSSAYAQDAAVEGEVAAEETTTTEVTTETTTTDVAADDAVAEEGAMDAGGGQAAAYTQRGLTLPKGTLRVDFAPADRAFLQTGAGFRVTTVPKPLKTFMSANVGAGFGIMDNLEAGAIVLPLNLAPSGVDTFGDLSVYGRYQFMQGNTQVAAHLGLQLPTSTRFALMPALPVKLVLGDNMHLNTGIGANIALAAKSKGFPDTNINLMVPVEFAVNVMPALFLGVGTGVTADLSPDAFKYISIPLNLFGGYTLDLGNKMLLDIVGQFGIGGLAGGALNIGDGAKLAGTDGFYTDSLSIVFGATFHYGLM